jgi:hypothetical protein
MEITYMNKQSKTINMKRTILVAVGLLIAIISYSQNNAVYYATAFDTLTGADTGAYQYPGLISTPYSYAIQHSTVKIAGTGASTNGYTQRSLDGTNWVSLDSIQTISNGSGYRTVVNMQASMAPYLRVYALQTGTVETTKQKIWWQLMPEKELYYFPAPPTYQLITNDTVTDTDTSLGAYPSPLNGEYAYCVQIVNDEISGTATNTVTIQTSNDNTNWTTLETMTLTTDTTTMRESFTGELGRYVRVLCTNSGTGVHKVNAYIQLYLKKL